MRKFAKLLFSTTRYLQSATLVVPKGEFQYQLRPYQEDCIRSCINALQSGLSRIAVSLATGGGKTVIFTNLIPKLPENAVTGGNKVLILVHRKELAEQLVATIRKFLPHYSVELDMADSKASHTTDITVASVQTLNSLQKACLHNYLPQDYKAIIVDECHHAVSPSYINIFEYFDALGKNSKIPVIGFSATLKRHDKVPLGNVFQEIVYNKDLIDMIRENWLVDVTITPVYASFNLQEVPLTASGDYDLACLSRYVNTPQVNQLVLQTYLKYKKEFGIKSTLFFCVNIDHLRKLSDLFKINNINCQYITGSTKKLVREKLIQDFRNGDIEVLMNCSVFTEGTDIPNIDSVFLVRPTKSRALLIQMIGRGLRLHLDKLKCHIVDFVDIKDTGIQLTPTLTGRNRTASSGLFTQEAITSDSPGLRPDETISLLQYTTYNSIHEYLSEIKAVKDPDYITFKKNRLPWIRVGRRSWLMALNFSTYIRIDLNKSKQYELKQYFSGGRRFGNQSTILKRSLNLDEVLQEAENYYQDKHTLKPPLKYLITPKQLKFLHEKFMISIEDSKVNGEEFEKLLQPKLQEMTRAKATDLIFGYSVGGKYCLQSYISEKILPKKEIDKNKSLLL